MAKVEFRHVFKMADGETIICAQKDAYRTLDKRGAQSPTQTVWEIKTNGVIRRFWPEDIADWNLEQR